MARLLFIAGIGHSGSTVLSLALGSHSRIVTLGEIHWLVRAKRRQLASEVMRSIRCSCGAVVTQCEFWGELYDKFEKEDEVDQLRRFGDVVSRASHLYGEDVTIVDTSKVLVPYLSYAKENCDLRVIYLVRDMRSWIYSRSCRLNDSICKLAWRWYARNRAIEKGLKGLGIRPYNVGYEEAALYPDEVLPVICDYLGLSYEVAMLSPENAREHIVEGNIARLDNRKRARFIYDARWLVSGRLLLLAPFLRPMLGWNNKRVYSHFDLGRTTAFGKKQRNFRIFGDARKEELIDERMRVSQTSKDRQ